MLTTTAWIQVIKGLRNWITQNQFSDPDISGAKVKLIFKLV